MRDFQRSIGRERAIELAESNWWKDKSARDICDVQLFTVELCMPFGEFHKAMTEALGRSVWTHEFASLDRIKDEYLGDRPAPTMEQIIGLLPAEKTIVLAV